MLFFLAFHATRPLLWRMASDLFLLNRTRFIAMLASPEQSRLGPPVVGEHELVYTRLPPSPAFDDLRFESHIDAYLSVQDHYCTLHKGITLQEVAAVLRTYRPSESVLEIYDQATEQFVNIFYAEACACLVMRCTTIEFYLAKQAFHHIACAYAREAGTLETSVIDMPIWTY